MNVYAEELKKISVEILTLAGVSEKDSTIVADHLVEANLRGRDSHGVFIRLPRIIKGIEKGTIKPRCKVKVINETPAIALLDGGNGIGQVVSMKAIRLAIKKAKKLGIGVVGVRRSSHIGFLGYYTEYAANENMIGIVLTNTEPAMAPTGGAEPVLGTNPISIGIPTRDLPIVIDMATSIVSRGKILKCLQRGEKIKKGWAVDKEGEITEDPKAALEGALLPIAGPKGYCLAFGFDVLTGALVGASVGKDVKGTLRTEEVSTKGDLFIAINPSLFCGFENFLERVEQLKKQVKSCKKARGVSVILLPGEPEMLIREKRIAEGIPVDEDSWKNLMELKSALHERSKRIGNMFNQKRKDFNT